jgi:hypothetical protein
MTTGTDTKDMQWLVKSRSEVQDLLLALWTIAKDGCLRTSSQKLQFELLIATCFALWRSVFLAHGERTSSSINEHATKFLETLVRDNAIAYSQDRDSKAWTFGYYINDAYFRLEYYDRIFSKLTPPHAERVAAFLAAQGKPVASEWDAHLAWTQAFDAALDAAHILERATRNSA